MIIDHLESLPSENDLTRVVFDIFDRHPQILRAFLQSYASVSDFRKSTVAETWKKLPSGIPDMYFEDENYILIFENKMKAGFTKEQLPRYLQAGRTPGKSSKYFLIAPDTSRYKPGKIPQEYIRLTWDDIYTFLIPLSREMSDDLRSKVESILGRYRYLHFSKLFNELYQEISEESEITSPKLFSKDDYHGRHITIAGFSKLRFAIAIYLDAPSYVKLNPWWVRSDGANYKIIASYKPVRSFRDHLEKQFTRTRHPLEPGAPGYVVDINLNKSNSREAVCKEIVGLINKECRDIISLYQSMFA